MKVYIRPEWVYHGYTNPINAEEKKTFGEHAYLVALLCGGEMGDPDYHHEEFQIIRADSPEEAKKTYDKINGCRYFKGNVIGCVDEPYEPSKPEDIMLEYASVTRKPMLQSCGVVLKELPLDNGLTKDHIDELFPRLEFCESSLNREAFPIEFQGQYSAAMGFISIDASKKLKYNHEGLGQFIISILNDFGNGSDYRTRCRYEYEGIKIWLS